MPSITLTVPPTAVARVLAAYKYSALLPDGSNNPEGEGAFIKRMLMQELRRQVLNYERERAAQTAAESATPIDIN